MTVAGVLLEEGVVSPTGAQLQTLVVDMDVAVLMHLREMEDVEAFQRTTPMLSLLQTSS